MTNGRKDPSDGGGSEAWVISKPTTLDDFHQGDIVVQRGARFVLAGRHRGSLWIEAGASAALLGVHQGTLHVEREAEVTIDGRQQGSVYSAGLVTVAPIGSAEGKVHNDGTFILRGEQGGKITGSGEVDIRPEARIKQPDRYEPDGSAVYIWRG